MRNKILLSVVVNIILAIIFISLNIWAFNKGLEETFIALALIYGLVTIVANGILVYKIVYDGGK